MIKPICVDCKKTPDQLPEFVSLANEEGITPDDYVRREEGTYNRANGHFTCTDCYMKRGCPTRPNGWKAP